MSNLIVDQISPQNPLVPVNFTGPSAPTYNGVPLGTGGGSAGVGYIGPPITQQFTGDGSTTDFTLSGQPGTVSALDVSVGGFVLVGGLDFTLPAPTTLRFNVAPPTGETIFVKWGQRVAVGQTVGASDTFTGNGSTTAFTLSSNPGSQANLRVSVNGFTLVPGVDFFWTAGTALNFTTAPVNGAQILVQYTLGLSLGGGQSISEVQTATSGQTVFTLANPYIPGTGNIVVFVGGIKARGNGVDYNETDGTHITFLSGLDLGQEVEFLIGAPVSAASGVTASSYNDILTGDGSTTNFALSSDPKSHTNLFVSIGGVTQLPGVDFTWPGGANISFTTAPPNGEKILVRYTESLFNGPATGSVIIDTFTGNGSTTTYALSQNPGALNNLQVTISGISQTPGVDFTWPGGTSLVFTSAPPLNGAVVVRYVRSLQYGVVNSSSVNFDWSAAPTSTNVADWGLQTAARGVNILRYIPPSEWAAIFNRTSTTDISGYVLTAINAGITNLYFPQGKYRWATARIFTWSGSPIRIEGDNAVSSVNTGTTIEQTNAGAAITYVGAGTLTGFVARHLRFKYIGADVKAHALCISNGYINTIEHCVFESYAHKGTGNDRSSGLYFTALTGYPPILSLVHKNEFVGCCDSVYFDKAESNANYVLHNRIKSSTGYGLRLGDYTTSSFALMNVVAKFNDFEGNVDGDVYCTGGARGLVIDENYFEFAAVRPAVVLSTNISTPIHNSISIKNNTFVGDPGSTRGFVEAQYLDDFIFEGNLAANNLGKTRYGLKNSSTGSTWKNVRVRMMSTPSGQVAPTTLNDGYTDRDINFYDSNTATQNWSPTVTFGGAATGIVFTSYGEIVDDGQYVLAAFRIIFSNKGTATGTFEIGGLPIPNTSNGSLCFIGSGAMSSNANLTGITGALYPGMAAANATSFRIFIQGATQTTSLTDASFTNTSSLNGWIRYKK